MLFIYLAVLGTAIIWVVKTLGPEMAKPPLPAPTAKNTLKVVPYEPPKPVDKAEKVIERLETLLAEKNRSISLLETELKVFHTQVSSFDKVKTLLEQEIQHLRDQNRIFRSELGLPALQSKENSIK